MPRRHKSRMVTNLLNCLQAAILGAFTASLFLTSVLAQPPDDFSVDYTGALFGYYRIESPNHVKDAREGSPIRKFHDDRLGHESRLLLGMGDNFAPEFGASIQLVGTGDCEQKIKSGARDPYPPEILYKESDRYARRADCDNVANFLMQEKYRAVVPGREDFIYSAEWLRQLAWSLKEISGPKKGKISCTCWQPTSGSRQAPANRKGVTMIGAVLYCLPAVETRILWCCAPEAFVFHLWERASRGSGLGRAA